MKILGMAGSLRQGSFNRSLLRVAGELLPEGVELGIFDLVVLPMFNQDQESDLPESVIQFKQKIKEADAILFVTPEHNHSIPAVLKNAIDWGSRPYGDNSWDGKPVAIMGASPAMTATARAQVSLRQTFVFLNIHPINKPEVMIGAAHEKFDADGRLIDERTREFVRSQLIALVDWANKIK